ncbi:hypothetical protein AGLY_008020 [Aphis glycines]|uniref:Golgi apparatus protein 1 n=1 Tax=Aphis glycines TaxID=307491 RepID=A0A6G0TLZ1_APHGL|nr:hypothetical protein AGLY_008020 [Aphis glycines]
MARPVVVTSVLLLLLCAVRASAVDSLLAEPSCVDYLKLRCANAGTAAVSKLDILECIQLYEDSDFSGNCPKAIWTHLKKFMAKENLRAVLWPKCRYEIEKLNCERDKNWFGCIVDKKQGIRNNDCLHLIMRIENIAFSDFRLITNFSNSCQDDINKFHCYNISVTDTLYRGRVLECLQSNIDKLSPKQCLPLVYKLSEWQADNIKFDYSLHMACLKDKEKLCADIPTGSGLVYNCLAGHIGSGQMSLPCQNQLWRREKLISGNIRVSKGLTRACREDIRTYRCRRLVSDDKDVRLAQLLLCLENAIHNGSKVSSDCQFELMEHRKLLLQNHHLSPEVVSTCSNDIEKYCRNNEVSRRTIHCLMDHSKPSRQKNRIDKACQKSLQKLMRITNIGEDWRVDPVLQEMCQSEVDKYCSDRPPGYNRVISCLLEKLFVGLVQDKCKNALLPVQYFINRDFTLDPALYQACYSDASRICKATGDWIKESKENLILPCLTQYYRPFTSSSTGAKYKLKPKCKDQVRKVMIQRAISVDLNPEIAEACIKDLPNFCHQKTGVGEEMLCLQDHFTNKKMTKECKESISRWTEAQAEDIQLNPVIRLHCKPFIQQFCSAELLSKDEIGKNDVMDCLIKNKNNPEMKTELKCRAAVEHFQLISMNDYRFTLSFKEACRSTVIRYCPKSRTKPEVVACLSEVVRNDTITDSKHKVTKPCRQQLRAQLLQQREFLDLDPVLKKACQDDITKHCSNMESGSAQVLVCLEMNKSLLSDQCHRVIFLIQRQDLTDSSSDYVLLTKCHKMLQIYCKEENTSRALSCLKKFKHDLTFEKQCQSLVIQRMIEQSDDYRLDPALHHSCQADINLYCSQILAKLRPESEYNGKVLQCLKEKFRQRKLKPECEKQVSVTLRESALNYKLNPLLRSLCTTEIKELCRKEEHNEGNGDLEDSGQVEECLKQALSHGLIDSRACRLEVAGLIEESKADINVDPLLQRACFLDITKYCDEVPQGAGRHLQCLQSVVQSKTKTLSAKCHDMLLQRMEMFKNAKALIYPESLQQLYGQVAKSPSKKYLIVVLFTFMGLIFIVGLFCGRVSRRSAISKKK